MQFNDAKQHETMLNDVISEMKHAQGFHIRNSFTAIISIWSQLALSKRTKLDYKIDKNLPENLNINGLKLQHCLNNLVSNAVQHTKDGEIQLIATKLNAKNGSYLALCVKDTGLGIKAKAQKNIFEHKPQLTPKTYGYVDTSLPITNELIKEMQGRILMKSAPKQGSLFAIILPLPNTHELDLGKTQFPTNTANYNNFSHLNILVVDDYTLNQLTIKTLLGEHLGQIYSATHGYEALDILAANPIDIILMDIHMPILDGIETTMRIRASDNSWANIPIYAMTADPQYQHKDLCIKIGMDGALAKPLRRESLFNLLQNHLSSQKRIVNL